VGILVKSCIFLGEAGHDLGEDEKRNGVITDETDVGIPQPSSKDETRKKIPKERLFAFMTALLGGPRNHKQLSSIPGLESSTTRDRIRNILIEQKWVLREGKSNLSCRFYLQGYRSGPPVYGQQTPVPAQSELLEFYRSHGWRAVGAQTQTGEILLQYSEISKTAAAPVTYLFLNFKRIKMFYDPIAYDFEFRTIEVLQRWAENFPGRLPEVMPTVKMLELIVHTQKFVDFDSIQDELIEGALKKLPRFVTIKRNFFCKGWKPGERGNKPSPPDSPILHWKKKFDNRELLIKVRYAADHENMISVTSYAELKGRRDLVCYGEIRDREVRDTNQIEIVISALAIGLPAD